MKDYKNKRDTNRYNTDRWWSCLMKEYYRRKTCLMFFHKITILAPYNPVTSGREIIQFMLKKARLQTVFHFKKVYGSQPQFSAYISTSALKNYRESRVDITQHFIKCGCCCCILTDMLDCHGEVTVAPKWRLASQKYTLIMTDKQTQEGLFQENAAMSGNYKYWHIYYWWKTNHTVFPDYFVD